MNINNDKNEIKFDVVETTSDNYRGFKSPSKLKPFSSNKTKKKKLGGYLGEIASSYETS